MSQACNSVAFCLDESDSRIVRRMTTVQFAVVSSRAGLSANGQARARLSHHSSTHHTRHDHQCNTSVVLLKLRGWYLAQARSRVLGKVDL